MEHYFISFFPPFVLLLYLCNGYKLHPLKRIKNILFCYFCSWFFFFTCYFKDTQRNKQLWYWNSIVPAPPEHNPKKKNRKPPAGLSAVCACVNINVCCSHIIFFFTESSFWNKDSVFSECSETFVDPYILNL